MRKADAVPQSEISTVRGGRRRQVKVVMKRKKKKSEVQAQVRPGPNRVPCWWEVSRWMDMWDQATLPVTQEKCADANQLMLR